MKQCKFCSKEFEPFYKSDIYCNGTCKAKGKLQKRINNWVNAKKPARPKHNQRIHIMNVNDMP